MLLGMSLVSGRRMSPLLCSIPDRVVSTLRRVLRVLLSPVLRIMFSIEPMTMMNTTTVILVKLGLFPITFASVSTMVVMTSTTITGLVTRLKKCPYSGAPLVLLSPPGFAPVRCEDVLLPSRLRPLLIFRLSSILVVVDRHLPRTQSFSSGPGLSSRPTFDYNL